MPPSTIDSRKLLSVSARDAVVSLSGRGDSLYLGKYRKIKIPFDIMNATFNWKTRAIEFFFQNDGLSNTKRVRFKGVLLQCQNTKETRIVAHYGESEIVLTKGVSKEFVKDWSHALDDRRQLILNDASQMRLAALNDFFDFCTRDTAEKIAQHAGIENRLLELCTAMKRKEDEMSVKQFLQRYAFPVCPSDWSKNLRDIFKREFSQALKAHESFEAAETKAMDSKSTSDDGNSTSLFNNDGVLKIEAGDQRDRVLKEYAIEIRTRGHHLLNCFLFLDHFEILDAMLACKGWLKECVRNKIWRPLTQIMYDEEDPDDLNSHEYLWWRTRFMKLCTIRRTACAVNFTHYTHRVDKPGGFLSDGGYCLTFETEKEKNLPNFGWAGDWYASVTLFIYFPPPLSLFFFSFSFSTHTHTHTATCTTTPE